MPVARFSPVSGLFLLLMSAPLLSGCIAVAAGGAIAGISAARQERTVGNAVDDIRINSSVQARLYDQHPSHFVDVSTTVVEGRVLMTGRVDQPDIRLDASRAAWSVEGLKRVDNEIEVTDQSGVFQRPKDIWIRTKIATNMLTTGGIRDVNYTIDCVNGVVYLTGVGQDQAELDRVIALAESTDGVRRVESYVVLKDDPARLGMVSAYEQR